MALTEVQHWPMDTLCERPDICSGLPKTLDLGSISQRNRIHNLCGACYRVFLPMEAEGSKERPSDVCRCGHFRNLHTGVRGCLVCAMYSRQPTACKRFRKPIESMTRDELRRVIRGVPLK